MHLQHGGFDGLDDLYVTDLGVFGYLGFRGVSSLHPLPSVARSKTATSLKYHPRAMFDTLFLLDLLRLFLLRSSGENKKNVHAIPSAGLPSSVLCLRLFSTLCVFFFILYLMLGEQGWPGCSPVSCLFFILLRVLGSLHSFSTGRRRQDIIACVLYGNTLIIITHFCFHLARNGTRCSDA